ncbi:unnamed protein product [Fusarium graminearum]|uniref:Chromosome 4, complete genome n=1 Tax=Gibberella zeae (strain ATCC MYA-4620 / CBS 123657 / FGSC 9075 / NRRL 31084 / PH-1) TaxID=229533 RepID=A0A098DQY5_GIBZE|nr:unnamed protein product [Fusarium graminearum]CZS72450.1 unnamed protein product [Fusarium graminearum]
MLSPGEARSLINIHPFLHLREHCHWPSDAGTALGLHYQAPARDISMCVSIMDRQSAVAVHHCSVSSARAAAGSVALRSL